MRMNSAGGRRAVEIFYRLSLQSEFQDAIEAIRKQIDVSIKGKNRKQLQEQYAKRRTVPTNHLFRDLAKKYGLTFSFAASIEEAVYGVFVYSSANPMTEAWLDKRDGLPVISIKVFPSSSKGDVFGAAEALYPLAKEKFNKVKIRSSKYKERDALVSKFWSRSRQELGLKKGEYREMKIAKLLAAKGFPNVSEENIKKIAYRQRQLRKWTVKGTP